jgi:hypothetical protein
MYPSVPFWPVVSYFALVCTGILVHVVDRNMPVIRRFLSELRHPTKSWKTFNQTAFSTFISLSFAALATAIGFAVSGYYKLAAIFFATAWLFVAISAWIGFSVVSRKPRIAYTAITWLLSAAFFCFGLYSRVPNIENRSPSGDV